jgi:hypothetical protein
VILSSRGTQFLKVGFYVVEAEMVEAIRGEVRQGDLNSLGSAFGILAENDGEHCPDMI